MGWGDLPWWKRLLLAPLAVVMFPVSLAAVLLVLLPVALGQAAFCLFHWVRFRVAGFPMPPKGPVEPPPGIRGHD